jgi:cell division protein FtsW
LSRTYVFARSAPSAEYDRSLTWAALVLAAMGLVMVYSASIATAESSRFTGNNAAWYLARHGVFLAAALAAAIGVFLLPVKFWQGAAPWLFGAGVVLLVLVLVPGIGREVNGARRWLDLPMVGVQPS